jgi:hypothetical protein
MEYERQFSIHFSRQLGRDLVRRSLMGWSIPTMAVLKIERPSYSLPAKSISMSENGQTPAPVMDRLRTLIATREPGR